MKKIILFLLVLISHKGISQAYKGLGDIKGQVGVNLQDGGSGIFLSSDFGIGENMSCGLTANYLLSVAKNDNGNIPKFHQRIDIKARFNANLGSVFQLDKKMDIYPGLDLGLNNFGAHFGFRYFFTQGFGVFSEAGFPISRYNKNDKGFDKLNNQFVINIGASFNL